MIGATMDSWLHGKDANLKQWFFWKPDAPQNEERKSEPISDGASEEDLNLGRRTMLDAMGIDHAGRKHSDRQC